MHKFSKFCSRNLRILHSPLTSGEWIGAQARLPSKLYFINCDYTVLLYIKFDNFENKYFYEKISIYRVSKKN